MILPRMSCSPIVEMSIPSIEIFPWDASTILNNANVRDDFPAPVRPTIPICQQIFLSLPPSVSNFMNDVFMK